MVMGHTQLLSRPLASSPAISRVLLLLLLLLPLPVAADCECGYTTTTPGSGSSGPANIVFADILESDFTRVDYLSADYKGSRRWARQAFAQSANASRGSFGEAFVTGNVVADSATIKDAKSSGPNNHNSNGGDDGLQLIVGSKVVDDMVQNAEIATTELDYFYGTYRVGLKVTDVPGTCTAFFWYFNDTQEIDMEFLSHEFNPANKSYPVNLVLQTPQSRAAGYDASGTSGLGTFQKHALPFDPTAGFHEYRFDFLPDRVVFYADGAILTTMTAGGGGIPSRSGNLLLSHWSNGNPGWSAGPPATDARSVVSYVKAYFNSSDPTRAGEAQTKCAKAAAGGDKTVCKIPEGDRGFFFSNPGSGGSDGGSGGGANGGQGNNGNGHNNAASLMTATGRLGSLATTVALGAAIWIVGLR